MSQNSSRLKKEGSSAANSTAPSNRNEKSTTDQASTDDVPKESPATLAPPKKKEEKKKVEKSNRPTEQETMDELQKHLPIKDPLNGFKAPKTVGKKAVGTMEQRLNYCCDQLGIERQNLGAVTNIDFVLDDVCRMDFMGCFPNCIEAKLINQGIQDIEGLEKLKHLEKLWVSCNSLEVIRGLDRLHNLKQLFLSQNRIRRIRGLNGCVNLERLWIDNNRIEVVEGLNNQLQLVELNLAGNCIETIGTGFDMCTNLKDLNLSANRIGNFKEVLNLNRLPALEICTFSDPNYGDNPIYNLCNYQTYVLFHLPKLRRLDTFFISEENKNSAETTFMKKRMYYNMRIKTIRRNASNMTKLLKICRKVRICKLDIQTSKLIKKVHEITREHEERQYLPQHNKAEYESMFTYGTEQQKTNPLDKVDNAQLVSDIENKRALIQGRMHDKNEDLKDLDTICESLRRKIQEIADQNIHRLITELETGGNIRFEEGRLQDKWFSSCVDLVRSRFNAEQMKGFGIIGINVTRVTRIHNRFLRNRFEEKLEQLVDLTDNQYRRSLEYLFYGVNPAAPNEIFKAMEEGFRSPTEYAEQGLPHYVSLVNSVASAETARIAAYLKAEEGYAQIRSAAKNLKQSEFRGNNELAVEKGLVQIPSGQLLVCKIFLQKSVHDNAHPHFNPAHSASEIWKCAPIEPRHNQNVQSVFRTKENDNKQRLWFVLDNALVLPEYLVEFDYITNPSSIAENRRLGDISVINEECNNLLKAIPETQRVLENTSVRYAQKDSNRFQSMFLQAQDLDRSDMGCLKKSLHNFMTQCHIKELMDNNFEFTENDQTGQAAIENSMPPEIPLRSQIDRLTRNHVVNICREQELTKVIYLNLFNNKLRKIEGIKALVNLETLILAFNEIDMIEGLECNPNLKKLDLGHNFIRKIEHLDHNSQIIHLDLSHNWIEDINYLQHVSQFCPNVKELGLKCNSFSNKKTYRATTFTLLPNLVKLDGLTMSDKDQALVCKGAQALGWDILVKYFQKVKKNLFNIELDARGEPEFNGWERTIEEIVIQKMQINKICNLSHFMNLRRLNLFNNSLSMIQGLESCRLLEELNLEKNKITQIQNIENLKYLKKLDLGSNKIKRIQNVTNLMSLTQLSLENNEITRLDGLEDLQCLMELYMGNNMLGDIKEIIKLKDLQRLIILDISGNSFNINRPKNNRIYCIFHLRKLRVLDGISIDPQEHIEAKDTFSGRLTDEILVSRCNGRALCDLRELDLSNCKLRDFEDMFDSSNCPNLRDLNLSHNNMSTLKGFGYLPHLRNLRLKANRIETLFYKPSPEEKNFRRGLFGLPGLEFLDVSFNQLAYLHGLQYSPLKELKTFLASNNEIVKIEHLDKLRMLQDLDLSKNKIRQIDSNSFSPQLQITSLRIDENGLRSLANIEKLQNLNTLSLAANRIGEFHELEKLVELPMLQYLSLASNPITRKPNYRMAVVKRLNQLVMFDNKEVTIDERRRFEGVGGVMVDQKVAQPMVHFQQSTVKVPVKLSSVNFDGVLNNMKVPDMQNQMNNNGRQPNGPMGMYNNGQGDIGNLIQVSSFQMGQAQSMMHNQGISVIGGGHGHVQNYPSALDQMHNGGVQQNYNGLSIQASNQTGMNNQKQVGRRPSTKNNDQPAPTHYSHGKTNTNQNSTNHNLASAQPSQLQPLAMQGSGLNQQSPQQMMQNTRQHRMQNPNNR